MRRNMSGNLGLYKYLCPGSVYVTRYNKYANSSCNYYLIMRYKKITLKNKMSDSTLSRGTNAELLQTVNAERLSFARDIFYAKLVNFY